MPGALLPLRRAVRGTEQAGQIEELPQDRRPALPEGVVRDEAVLLPDPGRVRRVLLGPARQDRQIGVAQHLAVAVALGGGVRDGEPDQPGDLGHHRVRHPRLGQRALGQRGAALLVLAPVGPVHRVVEPGGEPYRLYVVGVGGQGVDVVQDGPEVGGRVVPALRLGPAGEQVLGVRQRIGALRPGPCRQQRVVPAAPEPGASPGVGIGVGPGDGIDLGVGPGVGIDLGGGAGAGFGVAWCAGVVAVVRHGATLGRGPCRFGPARARPPGASRFHPADRLLSPGPDGHTVRP